MKLRHTIFALLAFVALAGSVKADNSPEWREAVNQGIRYEQNRQWLKAIQHYNKALKSYEDSRELQYGLRRSKIHFGIKRRYTDTSYERELLTLSEAQALNLFDAIIGKVRGGFVDSLSSTAYVAHGTESLYLALANRKFVEKNLRNVPAATVQNFRLTLRKNYWNKPVSSQSDARRQVEMIADSANRSLGLNKVAVILEYVFGGCNSLDDYSNCLTPEKLDDLYSNIKGEFVGLGIEMKAETGKGMVMLRVIENSPAQEGGLRNGDYIVNINGTDVRDMTTDEAAKLLRGEKYSRVQLSFHTPSTGQTRTNTFTRRPVAVKAIPVVKMVDTQNGVGYIKLAGFQKSTAKELDAAIAQLQREGMKSLILDVRGNPGGLLTAAVEVLDRFIAKGRLVSTKGRTQDQNWSYSAHHYGTHHFPLALLVDGNSASASEIVAGAIRDHKRGQIIGRQTYGKWSVQSIFPVRYATGLRLTTAKFYSPNGHTHGKVGVRPNIIVDLPETEITTAYRGEDELENDRDVAKAVEVLSGRYTARYGN